MRRCTSKRMGRRQRTSTATQAGAVNIADSRHAKVLTGLFSCKCILNLVNALAQMLFYSSWTIVSLACSLLRAHLAHAVDPFQDPLLMPRYCGSVCCVGLHASFSFRTLSYICSTYHLGSISPPPSPLFENNKHTAGSHSIKGKE